VFSSLFSNKTRMVRADEALPGRDTAMRVPERHFVNGNRIVPPFPEGLRLATFGMGCFWGAERKFWQAAGVYSTAVGYGAGFTKHPTYEEVCSGKTGHNELVRVIWDPARTSYAALLTVFWESHDPTQGMRQGNDVGTQYRSGIYVHDDAQREAAEASRGAFGERLTAAGYGAISTEIVEAGPFYYAEDYHQQYLGKNPGGYCGLGGTGVSCPTSAFDAPPRA
jgi:peptide-methionine (S)-S-oxide reductase